MINRGFERLFFLLLFAFWFWGGQGLAARGVPREEIPKALLNEKKK